MKALQKQRLYDTQRDAYYRKAEREKLDGYGWTMSLDSVRTPEEILLIKQRFERFERQIDRLQPRIGRVLRLRLGINCKACTLDEIAEQYGVTKERIRQMEAKAVRIVKRQVWIEEKPEDYHRQQEETAKAYAERRRLEREAEIAKIKANSAAERALAEERLRHPGLKPSQPREPDGRFVARTSDVGRAQMPQHPHERTILHEIAREQHRALALEREYLRALAPVLEYRGWAEGRERKLLPASMLYGMPYAYKMRHVPIKRDWLNVATKGFEHGA